MAIKIVFIGAGSLGFTRTIVHDILSVRDLRDSEIVLHDINADGPARRGCLYTARS